MSFTFTISGHLSGEDAPSREAELRDLASELAREIGATGTFVGQHTGPCALPLHAGQTTTAGPEADAGTAGDRPSEEEPTDTRGPGVDEAPG